MGPDVLGIGKIEHPDLGAVLGIVLRNQSKAYVTKYYD